MFGVPFSRYSIRKYILMFGSLFSNVVIDDGKGGTKKVPISHANKEHFYKILYENPKKRVMPEDGSSQGGNRLPQVKAYLPRMSYQMISPPTYDPSRKRNQINEIRQSDSMGQLVRTLSPVPYILPFELSVWTRTYREMLVIMEQIVPFFQPHYNVTVREYPDIGVNEYDVPVNYTGANDESELEGNAGSMRILRWSLGFEVYGHLAPPTFDPNEIIKTVVVNFHGDTLEINDDNKLDEIEEVADE